MNISELPIEEFVKYLKLYNAEIDWLPHLKDLGDQLYKKTNNRDMAKLAARKQAAFAILYPEIDHAAITDPPFKLLYYAAKHSQLDTKDWGTELVKVIENDAKIKRVRDELISLGTIDPIYYVPRWREAFCKLMDEVVASGIEVETPIEKRFEFLVKCYGGTIINTLFQPQYVKQVNKILNWRTPYFVEKMIHKVHKSEDLVKIKALDLREIGGEGGSRILSVEHSTERKEDLGDDDF